MDWSKVAETLCPVARSLSVLGDRWTMLILREAFLGTNRFDDFQAQTGMSPHLLSMRLKRLEKDGVLARRKYRDRPTRHAYLLTEKGAELYPVLLALKGWGEKWLTSGKRAEPAIKVIHRACECETGLKLTCPACAKPFGARDARVALGSKFARERDNRRAGFARRRAAD